MLTALRLHGQRPASVAAPEVATAADYQRQIQELTQAYEMKLSAAGGDGSGARVADLEKQLAEANARMAELELSLSSAVQANESGAARLSEVEAAAATASSRVAELEALLDSATAAPAAAAPSTEPDSGKPKDDPKKPAKR